MALSAWDKTRIHGTWYSHDGTRLPGTYIVTMPARVTVEQGEAIVPAGVYTQGDLNATGTTDPSLDVMVPSNDDPDVTPLGWQVKVEVNLTMPNGARVKENYVIDTPVGGTVNLRTIPIPQTISPNQTMLLRGVAGGVAALDTDGDVIDAAGVKVTGGGGGGGGASTWDELTGKPTTFPPSTHSHPIGQVTGLQSALDGKAATNHNHDGIYVKPADLPAPQPAPTWDTLTGKPAVIAAGTSQTAARDAIGAGTSSLQLGTGSTTAARGDHGHDLNAVTDTATRVAMTPAERAKLSGVATEATANATDAQLRARSSHTGTQAISTVTGLQPALDGKAPAHWVGTQAQYDALPATDADRLYLIREE